MLRCWDADQDSRPDFTSLVKVLGDFLDTGVRQVTAAVCIAILNNFIATYRRCGQFRTSERELERLELKSFFIS